MGFSEHFLTTADGLSLYYRQYSPRGSPGRDTTGSRAAGTVICLPGLTRNSRDFESLAGTLSEHYHVLTPDLRGRGQSGYDPQWSNYHPAKYVEDMFALLDALQIARCAVIGTSLGGLMGMIMGALQPQRLSCLVLNDIGPDIDPRGVARIRSYVGKLPPVESWQDAAAQARQVHTSALPDFDEAAWMDFARRTYREDGGRFRSDVDPNVARAFEEPAAQAPDLWPFFALLARIPLLTIRGELSDLFSEQTLARMHEVHPTMRSVRVPNRGHAPTLDEPASRQAITQFLAEFAV